MKQTVDISVAENSIISDSKRIDLIKFRHSIKKAMKRSNIRFFNNHLLSKKDNSLSFVGCTLDSNFSKLQNELANNFVNIHSFSTQFFDALYFENHQGYNAFLFKPSDIMIGTDETALSYSSDINMVEEIRVYATNNKIAPLLHFDNDSLRLICEQHDKLMCKKFRISSIKLHKLKYKNEHKQYIHYYKQICKSIEIENLENDHIKEFSKIYYQDILVMSKELKPQDKGISIHDAATCLAHFPLMLSELSQEELMGIKVGKITVSDIHIFLPKLLTGNLFNKKGRNSIPIEFKKIDLINGIEKSPVADVTILNDVLEHFEEKDSFRIMENLWSKTSQLMLIHVPIEEIPDPMYGHKIKFDPEKLRTWSKKLKGGSLISDSYFIGTGKLTEFGFLIMKRD